MQTRDSTPQQDTRAMTRAGRPDGTTTRVPVVSPEVVMKHSAYQAIQPVERPSYSDVDLDWARRPGRLLSATPKQLANTRFPPERQPGRPASPMHGRPNKKMPPVFGTAVPLHGLSGAIRRMAYRFPDHKPSHWLLKLLGDRVESWGHRAGRLMPVLLPVLGLGLVGRRVLR